MYIGENNQKKEEEQKNDQVLPEAIPSQETNKQLIPAESCWSESVRAQVLLSHDEMGLDAFYFVGSMKASWGSWRGERKDRFRTIFLCLGIP